MKNEGSISKIWTFVLACIILLAITAIADNHESTAPQQKINSTILNNGPVIEGSPIIFTGQCNGENTKLVLCRENTICNLQTRAPDLLCASAVSSTQEKACAYTATANEGGIHENDIATCCADEGECDTTVVFIEPWQVNTLAAAASLKVRDDNNELIQSIINQQGTITHLKFSNQPTTTMVFTNLQGTRIGMSKITRGIVPPDDVEFNSVFGLDLEEVAFTEATFTATALGSSLYRCKFWDFALSTCVGSWEFVKIIEQGKEYSFNLVPGSFGFAESTSVPLQQPEVPSETPSEQPIEVPSEAPPIEEPIDQSTELSQELIIEGTITNNGPIEEGNSITFSGSCNTDNTQLILCKENSICDPQAQEIDIICKSEITNERVKTCQYATEATDAGDHDTDIATCCTAEGECDTTTVLIDAWRVTQAPQTSIITGENMTVTPAIIAKKDYGLDEDASFDFEYHTKQELVRTNKWKEEYEVYEKNTGKTEEELALVREKIQEETAALSDAQKASKKQKKQFTKQNEIIKPTVFDVYGNVKDLDVEIEEVREGKFKITLPKQRQFKAGKYSIKVEFIKNGVTYTEEQDFTWGVLAINVDKSIYLPNEESFIGMGVLDDQGKIVCNAEVTLEITDPANKKTTLTTANGDIQISPECAFLGVTNLPDYYTSYIVAGSGKYVMDLTAVTAKGVRSIQDSFVVQSAVDFDVKRQGPTRIYPLVPYSMNITIKANKNHNGPINEYVPASFAITPQPGLSISTKADTKVLTWNKNLAQGATADLYYEFDAPDISPEFYLLGALDMDSFKEARQWQIASDQVSFQGSDTANSTSVITTDTSTISFTTGTGKNNPIILVGIGGDGATNGVDAVYRGTGTLCATNRETFSNAQITITGGVMTSRIFYLTGFTEDASARNICVDWGTGDSPANGWAWGLAMFENVDQTDPFAANKTVNGSAATSLTGTINIASGQMGWQTTACGNNGAYTANTGDTQQWVITSTGANKNLFVATYDSTVGTPTTMGGTVPSNKACNYAMSLVVLKEAAEEAPRFSSIVFDPVNETNYSLTQFYEFNATWTDNNKDNVFIVFDDINYSFSKGEVYNSSAAPTVFSFNRTGLAAADYNYTWFANDSSNNENQTPTQFYTVARAESGVNLTLDGNDANVTITMLDVVNITATREAGEGNIQLFLDEVLINEGITTLLSNNTNFTGEGDFNITTFHPDTENFTTNFTTFYVISRDNVTPIINLSEPLDNNVTLVINGFVNLTFLSNATENIQFANATLYHNLTGTFEANESVFIDGIFNETAFSLNIAPTTAFIWNVLYCDNATAPNCAFGDSNFTVTIERDTKAPIVNLSDPLDNNITSTDATANLTFLSNATDNGELANATLYHNLSGIFEQNQTTDINGTFNETAFSVDIAPITTFIWNVLYCDAAGNCGFADSNFTAIVNGIITNNLPLISNVILNATTEQNTTNDNLTVFFDVTDADLEDQVFNTTDWRKESISLAVLNIPFNEPPNNIVGDNVSFDYTTYGNNLSCLSSVSNLCPLWVPYGQVGGSYSTNGSLNQEQLNTSNLTNIVMGDEGITMMLWINTTRTSCCGAVMSLHDGDNIEKNLWLYNLELGVDGNNVDSELYVSILNETVNRFLRSYVPEHSLNATIELGAWDHVAVTYDPSTTNITIYVNGTKILTNNTDVSFPQGESMMVSLIDMPYRFDAKMSGGLDEVKVFNTTLSPEQIQAIYDAEEEGQSAYDLMDEETTVGDNWTVAVTASDLNETSTPVISENIEILAAANTAPTIEAIDGPGGNSIESQSITEDGVTDLGVTFTVTDADGAGDVDLSAINLTLIMQNGVVGTDDQLNASCGNPNNISGTEMNITCAVELFYWFNATEWNLTAMASDFSGKVSQNTTNFTLQETTAIVISANSLSFPPLTINEENTTSDSDPITINNTGNDNIDANNTLITGLDLVGEEDITQAIATGNFTVGPDTGGTPPLECNATQLVNATATNINGTIMYAGNRSISGAGVEDLYVCLTLVPPGLSAQAYSTLNSSAGWTVSVI